MEEGYSRDVVAIPPTARATAKRRASPLDEDIRSSKRSSASRRLSSGAGTSVPNPLDRRTRNTATVCPPSQRLCVNAGTVSGLQASSSLPHHHQGFLYEHGSFPSSGLTGPCSYQRHLSASGEFYGPPLHHQPVISDCPPSDFPPSGLGTILPLPPSFPASHIPSSSLPYASETSPIPPGPLHHSPPYNTPSFQGVRTTSANELSHPSPNMLVPVPVTVHNGDDGNGPSRRHTHTWSYHEADHIQGSTFQEYQWLGPSGVSLDVPVSPSGYFFQGHPRIPEGEGPRQLMPSFHPFQPQYPTLYPVSNLPSYCAPNLDSEDPCVTYHNPNMSGGLSYPNAGPEDPQQDLRQDDRYVGVVRAGDVENGVPHDIVQLSDVEETVVAEGTSTNGSTPTRAGFIRQHLSKSFSLGSRSVTNSGRRGLVQSPAHEAGPGLKYGPVVGAIASDSYTSENEEASSHSNSITQEDTAASKKQPTRKYRSQFDQDKKDMVNRTRKIGACLVCRNQRNRCPPNDAFPDDPNAPCGRCSRVSNLTSKKVMYRVPCIRSTITKLVLYRPGGLGLTRRWEGTKVKDVGDWADDAIRTIHMNQGLSQNPMVVRVRKFNPQEGDILYKGSQKLMLEPYCLADVEETAKYFHDYLSTNVRYLEQSVKASSCSLVRDTYAMAVRHATKTLPDAIAESSGATRTNLESEQTFLMRAIKLVYAIKHMSGSVKITGGDKLGMESAEDPSRPVWLPRMIVAQWDSIQNERILKGLRESVLSTLHTFLTSKNQTVWFTIYLVVFLFLHEVSVASKDRYRWAQENAFLTSWSSRARYGSGKLGRFVEDLQSSANTLLAHWEYYKIGVDLQTFDWSARKGEKHLGYLTQVQADFVKRSVGVLQEQDVKLSRTPEEGCWEHELYFISHMVKKHEQAIETFNYIEP